MDPAIDHVLPGAIGLDPGDKGIELLAQSSGVGVKARTDLRLEDRVSQLRHVRFFFQHGPQTAFIVDSGIEVTCFHRQDHVGHRHKLQQLGIGKVLLGVDVVRRALDHPDAGMAQGINARELGLRPGTKAERKDPNQGQATGNQRHGG